MVSKNIVSKISYILGDGDAFFKGFMEDFAMPHFIISTLIYPFQKRAI